MDAEHCVRCPLYKGATQTVFGNGRVSARIMLVGEQPGDQEDKQGHVFLGPAGRILDRALEAAALPRAGLYITNAVKHFKNAPRGKRRLHKRPNAGEIDACRWWLDLERRFVRPAVIVTLGAVALQGILRRPTRISALRGQPQVLSDQSTLIATIHPSKLLRIRDHYNPEPELRALVADLLTAREIARQTPG